MPDFTLFIIFIAVVLTVNIVILVSNKGKNKTDKGFQFVYYKLSYRRRMIRDLILMPFALIFAFVILDAANAHPSRTFMYFALLFAVIYGIFFAYNFTMWKKHEKNN